MGVGKLRITGYKDALESKEDFFIANSAKKESLKEKLKDLLLNKKVDALLCSDFESTMMTYRLAYENGINIPKDLKVIGFINGGLAGYLTPSISYVNQNPEKIGESAMNILSKRINNHSDLPIKTLTIDTEIVHLESTGNLN